MESSESAFLLGDIPPEIMPECIDDVILRFQDCLPDTEPPEVISVQTRPDAIDGECFQNVRQQVEEFGGSQCFGWRVNLIPNIIIYGEFHAVWMRQDGLLVDVSPVVPAEQKQVVFIRDRQRVYDGHRTPNFPAILWDVPEVHDYLMSMRKISKVDDAIDVALRQGLLIDKLKDQRNELINESRILWSNLRHRWNSTH
jgi:hypothetical protein